jgi:UDP-glucose 4-epimerase
MSQNILVTGGAGFIGSHTVVELASSGYKPIVLDNFSNSEPVVLDRLAEIIGSPVKFYKGSFQDIELLKKIFEKQKINGVIHFAAYKAVAESIAEPLKYYENNVAGFITLLKFAGQQKLPRLVFSSSATVYGDADETPTPETAPFKPATNPYGTTKQICENILHDIVIADNELRAVALRYFNPIGAHSSGLIGELPRGIPSNLVPFVTQTAAGWRDKMTVFGGDYDTADGSCLRDYIHVVDLAKAHIAALKHLDQQSPAYYDVFNVGTGRGSSVLEILRTFESATGQKVPYTIGPRRSGDVAVSCAAVDKIERELGWHAELDLTTGLKDSWRWQQTLKKSD